MRTVDLLLEIGNGIRVFRLDLQNGECEDG